MRHIFIHAVICVFIPIALQADDKITSNKNDVSDSSTGTQQSLNPNQTTNQSIDCIEPFSDNDADVLKNITRLPSEVRGIIFSFFKSDIIKFLWEHSISAMPLEDYPTDIRRITDCFTQDERYFCMIDKCYLKKWDTQTGAHVQSFPLPPSKTTRYHLKYEPSNNLLVIATDNIAYIFDPISETYSPIAEHPSTITDISYSFRGKYLVTSSFSGELQVYSIEDKKLIYTAPCIGPSALYAFSFDDSLFVHAHYKSLYMVNVTSSNNLPDKIPFPGSISACIFHPHDNRVFVAHNEEWERDCITIIDGGAKKPKSIPLSNSVDSLAFDVATNALMVLNNRLYTRINLNDSISSSIEFVLDDHYSREHYKLSNDSKRLISLSAIPYNVINIHSTSQCSNQENIKYLISDSDEKRLACYIKSKASVLGATSPNNNLIHIGHLLVDMRMMNILLHTSKHDSFTLLLHAFAHQKKFDPKSVDEFPKYLQHLLIQYAKAKGSMA